MTTLLAQLIAREEGFYVPGSLPQRNNNPGDLRHAPDETHPELTPNSVGAFPDAATGWKALEHQLSLYAGRGLTLQQAIYEFAPPSENDSAQYLDYVSKGLGVIPGTPMSIALTIKETPMNDPTTTPPGLVPSNSTVASGAGGALAVLIVAVCHQFGLNFPAGVEAAIAVIITTVAGYLPKAGRQ